MRLCLKTPKWGAKDSYPEAEKGRGRGGGGREEDEWGRDKARWGSEEKRQGRRRQKPSESSRWEERLRESATGTSWRQVLSSMAGEEDQRWGQSGASEAEKPGTPEPPRSRHLHFTQTQALSTPGPSHPEPVLVIPLTASSGKPGDAAAAGARQRSPETPPPSHQTVNNKGLLKTAALMPTSPPNQHHGITAVGQGAGWTPLTSIHCPQPPPASESSARKAGATMEICPQGGRLDPQDRVTEIADTHTRSRVHRTLAPNGEQQGPAESCHPRGLLTLTRVIQASVLGSTCVEDIRKHSSL